MIDMTLIRPLNKGQGHSFWVCFVVCTYMCLSRTRWRTLHSFRAELSNLTE